MIDFQSESVFKLRPVDVGAANNVTPMLIDGEEVLAVFQTVRDKVVFTNKRVIAINSQGMIGKKTDYTSMPYSKIQVYSIETSGAFDRDCEIEFYFSSAGSIRFEISGAFDIVRFNRIVSSYVL